MAVSKGIATGSTPRWPTLAGAWTSCSPTPRPSTSHGSAKSHTNTCEKALPLLNDGGSIILNSSDPNAKGNDGIGVYAAIMAALRSFPSAWASELRDRKIRVNVIGPDVTETPGINTLAGILNRGPNAAEELENYQRSIVPPARYGTAEEVANAALFLASDLSSFITGVDIPVDGGINQVARRVEDLSANDPVRRSQAEPGDRRRP